MSSFTRREPSKDTVRLHSSDADEVFCQPCGDGGNYEVAVGFCQNCEEYFCRRCINCHQKQRISKQHVILGKDKMPKGRADIVREKCDIMCDRHQTVTIKFYCTVHKVVACSECVVLDHADCNHKTYVKDIQQLSEDFIRSEVDFPTFNKNMDKLKTDLDEVESNLDAESENARKSNLSLVHAVRTLKSQVNNHLDNMEIELLKEADKIKSDGEKTLKDLKSNTATIKDELENTKRHLDANAHQIKSLFVLTMQAEHKMAKMEEDLVKVTSRRKLRRYQFKPSSDLNNILAGNVSFGNITDVKTEESSAKFKRDIYVKSSTEFEDCCPAGIAIMCPNRIVIGDSNNKTLKLIDLQSGSVLFTCNVSSSPKDLAVLNGKQLAVTFPNEKKIKFFDVDDSISMNKEHRVNGKCFGIAQKEGKLAVSYDNSGKIDVMNTVCQILYNVLPKQRMDDFLKGPHYVVFGHEKDTLIVSDNDTSKVSIVTFQGEMLRSFSEDLLRTPRGIAVAADGAVIVASCANDCLHLIARDFEKSRTLLQEDKNVRYPECISFDDSNNTLFVWCSTLGDQPYIDNVIKVFELL